jgi:hypothetical protein
VSRSAGTVSSIPKQSQLSKLEADLTGKSHKANLITVLHDIVNCTVRDQKSFPKIHFLVNMIQVLRDLPLGSASRLSFGRYIRDYDTRMPASCFPDLCAQNQAPLKAFSKSTPHHSMVKFAGWQAPKSALPGAPSWT